MVGSAVRKWRGFVVILPQNPILETRAMPRPQNTIPSLTHHKPSGKARVRIQGKDFYLGPWGSSEAQQKYGQLLADLAVGKLPEPVLACPSNDTHQFTIAELVLAFKKHAESYYVGPDGK